jgi:hypothetical protein
MSRSYNGLNTKNNGINNQMDDVLKRSRMENCKLLKIHNEFCVPLKNKNYLEKIQREYKKMINGILNNQETSSLIENIPFCNVINLYNDFVITKDELKYFDTSLFDCNYSTVNERGIRDFIKRKIEEQEYEQ